ncbi:BZ3500_MvSof-1268-A1-R1_Chr2-2g04925 [Microbotryum saponariae]|uniref:BZ3500_MvSof-1268-A1-R1_Chr2-2g04925 protein n=1 Tax=Microbotryum saponariae TaxID=289078 RepID=A0A2X0N0P9_9BASI|nr:BZ3500_MvSof-1268-A1-R1_Chr2-2g04925 [Microbotryum saponariae]SDA00492.1 BZ3501_MvSof-1269-A2-R1_Chr2-2g04599 [Microbotryum saponariae]
MQSASARTEPTKRCVCFRSEVPLRAAENHSEENSVEPSRITTSRQPERQQFILKLARAFMMFGAPSHRLEAQLQATARVLEINCQVIYIPAVMLVSFGDSATHTSEVRFVRQSSGLDLGKLKTAYMIYYDTIYDKISVTDASKQLDDLMLAGPVSGGRKLEMVAFG